LHVPEEQCSILEQPGRDLRANRQWFAARRAGRAYLGYMRLGYQVIEFLETGALTLPMSEPGRTRIVDVRNGRCRSPRSWPRRTSFSSAWSRSSTPRRCRTIQTATR
jgi:hypothetical protein